MFSEIRKLRNGQSNVVFLPPMPGITSSDGNQAKEKGLCGIDFYGVAEASYPKTWSAR
ncbi:MAG: hypothetical protein ABIN99_03835 [Nitrosospira sp.]